MVANLTLGEGDHEVGNGVFTHFKERRLCEIKVASGKGLRTDRLRTLGAYYGE